MNPIQGAFEFFLAFFFNLPLSIQNFLSLVFLLWFLSTIFHLIYSIRS